MNAASPKLHQRIKVLIVDDSTVLCKFLEKIFSRDPELEVVGFALDPYQARDMIKKLKPDVLTLDVEMPRMDGITFLKNLMRLHPMPVVMLSSLTAAGAEVTLDALDAGAVDFMVKRHPGSEAELQVYIDEIVNRVKQAGKVDLVRNSTSIKKVDLPDLTELRRKLKTGKAFSGRLDRVIGIGSSTGGPDALNRLLRGLQAKDCALVFSQHMPERFMQPFAARLNSWSDHFTIKIAEDGEELQAGMGYVAPGDHHLEVVNYSGRLVCKPRHTEVVSGHRPSVDVMFSSIAKHAPHSGIGVLLTGMGEDGAIGLTKMRKAGSTTIVQDEKSSAVWGMPGAAYHKGGADSVIALQQIGPAISQII